MFDFSTETILNVVADKVTTTGTGATGVLKVKTVGDFPSMTSTGKRKVSTAFKAVGYPEVKEISTIDLSGLVLADLVGKVIRLSVDVRLSGAESGEYSRWAVHKGQPFYAEYFVKTLPASINALATDLAAAFDKAYRKDGRALINVTSSTSNLLLTATTGYQVFEGAVLELIPNAFDDTPVLLAEGTVTTKGKQEFGTTWFLTKNLRLPTVEAIRFMGEFEDQRPLANTIYNQYTLTLQAERNIGSQSFVGGRGVSTTTHVFYVPQGAQVTAFEAALTAAGITTTVTP